MMNSNNTCACKSLALRVLRPQPLGLRRKVIHIGFDFRPTLVIGGGGSSELVEELFGLPDSMPSVEVMTDTEVYAELETIIPTMDADISSQQASEFSNTVRAIVSSESETIGEREGGSVIEQFFGVAGYEFISEETILQEMETIMQGLDNDLTAEMATNITAETQTIIH